MVYQFQLEVIRHVQILQLFYVDGNYFLETICVEFTRALTEAVGNISVPSFTTCLSVSLSI